ncbi:5-methylcytosine rRNA methyltransferase NSUN4 [Pectinophora gossypiella]|uniref:5-methylcytosine rRNA methyltransferase NSUN4 n=1 Tax=Pectinophora gossypiella TaxID=13191 RepID=UPI00214F190D|nr:5-methylcytosine rRNA methyltransferase NSUN4 [Pectinophora gossypiella]
MLTITNLCKSNHSITYLVSQLRFKSKVHWAKLRKKTTAKDKAMNHFDDFYGNVFGDKWTPMREALLRRTKYVAVINNYGDPEETMEYLTNRGAHCLKNLMSVQKEFNDQYNPTPTPPPESTMNEGTDKLAAYAAKLQSDEISSVYPADNAPETLETKEITLGELEEKKKDKIRHINKTLDQSLAEAEIDESRIIDPGMGLMSEALYQYVPATKLKGMDEWVPESLHYSFYSTKDKDFPLVTEPETEFKFPEHLKVFTYEMDSEWTMFPEPKRCQTGVFNYYPMDCGSVVAALALCLSPGDRVLDLCSAPGGKALVSLQTLLPDVIVCNDVSISRSNRTQHIFRDYLFDFDTSNKWRERVVFTKLDGRSFTDDQGFDKVLVDVPCTTDRLSVTRIEDNNLFRSDRIKERLRLPELQAQLLTNALSLVKVGGAVVYSTCSLSPVQNDGVVHMALKNAFETRSIIAAVKDLTPAVSALSSTLTFATGEIAPKYGQLVIPSLAANFGPSYISRLVRLK